MSDKQDKGDVPEARFNDIIATEWIGKQKGRYVEMYFSRAPSVKGKLIAVDTRFGRAVIKTDEGEEIIIYMSSLQQVRIPPGNHEVEKK